MRLGLSLLSAAALLAAACGRDLSLPAAPVTDTVRPQAPLDAGVEAAPAQGLLNVLWRIADSELGPAGHTRGVVVLRRDGPGTIDPPQDGRPVAVGRGVGVAVVVFTTEDPNLAFFDDTEARRGRQYTYGVVAHNSAYLWGPVAIAQGALAPSAPVAVAAHEDPEGGVEITWNLPDDGARPAALVLRAEGAPVDTAPPDEFPYAVGEVVGNARVVFSGDGERHVDTGVRAGVEYHYAVHAVGEGNIHSPARQVHFTLLPPRLAEAGVHPDVVGPRSRVEVDFTLARALVPLELPPVVTVAGRAASPVAGVEFPSFRFTYGVDGTEPEGPSVVRIEVHDYTGEGVRELPIEIDFTPPVLRHALAGDGPFRRGDVVTIEVVADEPLSSLLAFVGASPMACAPSLDPAAWYCSWTAGADPGPKTVSLAFTDRAGNGATGVHEGAFTVTP